MDNNKIYLVINTTTVGVYEGGNIDDDSVISAYRTKASAEYECDTFNKDALRECKESCISYLYDHINECIEKGIEISKHDLEYILEGMTNKPEGDDGRSNYYWIKEIELKEL